MFIEKPVEKEISYKRAEDFLAEGVEVVGSYINDPKENLSERDKAWAIMAYFFDGLKCRYIGKGERDEKGVELWKKEPRAGLFSSIV